ncbi:hypothetical protein N4R57_16605 [Rhodobacteraceae bacterium D3-12]|nr:hypothetical protein N4R57_16605 [Rhodobacteraceae bacterium D3-12]
MQSHIRGGAPVGLLAELGPVEAYAVQCLRYWYSGPQERNRVSAELQDFLGADLGQQAVEALQQICELCARHGRRPLMRHQIACKCLGADEACFANFIAAAAEGAREDAMLLASLIVRPDFASSLAGLAQQLGIALRQIATRSEPETVSPQTTRHTLH